jgi:hypothetical protein
MMLSRETQDLARRLFAYEAVAGTTCEQAESVVVRLSEKLRRPLCALVGVADYRSLLSRALNLAMAEVPSLSRVQVTADGSLLGLGEVGPQTDQDNVGKGGVILIAQLLGLFLPYLGSALTLRLVQDVSPHREVTAGSGTPAPFENILQEVDQLNNVSERLELLADQHPIVEEALMSISGNIRNTATALEVLAVVRKKSSGTRKNAPKQPVKQYLM